MKLQSMLEFVLEQKQIYISDRETPANIGLHNYLKYTSNYANFLKQELTLGMFVPVDEKGNVLEEPKCIIDCDCGQEEVHGCLGDKVLYNKAKSKVYFEGVYYCTELKSISTGVDYPNNGSIIAVYPNDNKEFCSMRYKTIEDLIPLGLTLTDHAKSLIF